MSIFETLTSLFAPNDCLGCGREGDLLCAVCLPDLPPLLGRCFRCHRTVTGGVGCAPCYLASGLQTIRAATTYDRLAKDLVGQLKFRGNQSAAAVMAQVMLAGIRLPSTALLTHVPATAAHVRQRGYDQAALLAKIIARQTGCQRALLMGRLGSQHQLGAGRTDRLAHSQHALYVKNRPAIQGRQIIIVDDVLTTGATVSAAAHALLRAGADRVDALVFAQA